MRRCARIVGCMLVGSLLALAVPVRREPRANG